MANPITSRIGTTVNLPLGGTYDLLMIKFTDGFPQSRLVFNIEDTPRKVTGVQKVAQIFLKLLFTSQGSNVIYPNQGTDFPNLVIGANLSTTDSLFQSELMAQIRSAESQARAILNTVTSDTASMLKSISLIGIDTSKESVTMYLRMLTEAGQMASIAVPFPELDLARSN